MSSANCPYCSAPMKSSPDPSWVVCEGCGSALRLKGSVTSVDEKMYRSIYGSRDVEEELKNDLTHYQSHLSEILRSYRYDTVIALGGGFPKAESFMNVRQIWVVDFMADFYESNVGLFKRLFPSEGKDIRFLKERFHPDNVGDLVLDLSSGETLVSLVHVLEHLSWEEQVGILDGLSGLGVDLFIYQPNPEKGDREGWIHYRAVEHIFMPSRRALEAVLEGRGFVIRDSQEIQDDLLLWGSPGTP